MSRASSPSYDPGDSLSEGEIEHLRDLGYEVSRNINGGHIARPSCTLWYTSARAELDFVRRVGEEAVRAIDAVWRVGGVEEARAMRADLGAPKPRVR